MAIASFGTEGSGGCGSTETARCSTRLCLEDPTHFGGPEPNPGSLTMPAFLSWVATAPSHCDLTGFRRVTVISNRRIIFRFEQGRVPGVDFVDYH
jgi:hypothetical protein